jgi:addiction module HigA family antidote
MMALQTFPPAPGSVLRRKLTELRLRQSDLARSMGVSAVRINQIINGRAPITPEMSLRLGAVTSTPAEYWLGLQRDFDLFRARRRLGSELELLGSIVPSSTQNDSGS